MIRDQGSVFRNQGSGFRVEGSGIRFCVSGFRVEGSEFRVCTPGFSLPAEPYSERCLIHTPKGSDSHKLGHVSPPLEPQSASTGPCNSIVRSNADG